MSIRFRKPAVIPTLATLGAVAVTMYLGIWQLQRLEWKNDLIATIERAQSEAPRPLESYTPEALTQAEWHNVEATGVLMHGKELYASPRFYNGLQGFAVLTPLAIDTPQGTQYVLINRGWVPPELKDAAKRAGGNPLTKVNVEGAIRTEFKQGRFTPDNEPAKNLWFWYDLPAMGKTLDLPLLPVLIDASNIRNMDGTELKEGPKPFPIEINIRNDHKGYAVTWFLIGLCAIGVYAAAYIEYKQ